MKYVLVTGGFDPLHSGHLEYFKEAKKLGHKLIVGVNSDAWLTRKKGRPFLPFEERVAIIKELKMVDQVIAFNDDDNTACHAIFTVLSTTGSSDEVIFANGGDRNNGTTPEYEMYKHQYGLSFAWSVGGDEKKNSSSWILDEWKAPKTQREWGYYRVLHEVPGMKVKELTVDPGKKLSMQKHNHRAEYWIVSEGQAVVNSMTDNEYSMPAKELILHEEYHVPVGGWHQLTNPYDKPVRIVEVQYGTLCEEEDIIRHDG